MSAELHAGDTGKTGLIEWRIVEEGDDACIMLRSVVPGGNDLIRGALDALASPTWTPGEWIGWDRMQSVPQGYVEAVAHSLTRLILLATDVQPLTASQLTQLLQCYDRGVRELAYQLLGDAPHVDFSGEPDGGTLDG